MTCKVLDFTGQSIPVAPEPVNIFETNFVYVHNEVLTFCGFSGSRPEIRELLQE